MPVRLPDIYKIPDQYILDVSDRRGTKEPPSFVHGTTINFEFYSAVDLFNDFNDILIYIKGASAAKELTLTLGKHQITKIAPTHYSFVISKDITADLEAGTYWLEGVVENKEEAHARLVFIKRTPFIIEYSVSSDFDVQSEVINQPFPVDSSAR